MSLVELIKFSPLVLLSVVFLLTLLERGRVFLRRSLPLLFKFLIVVAVVIGGLITREQYSAWKKSGLGQYLLPQYQGNNSFYTYSFWEFFASHLISLSVAVFLLWYLIRANKKYDDKFFEEEEPYLVAITVFLMGHPGWLLYFVLLITAYLGWHLFLRLRGEKEVRLPLYHLWLVVGILTSIVSLLISRSPIWLLLKI